MLAHLYKAPRSTDTQVVCATKAEWYMPADGDACCQDPLTGPTRCGMAYIDRCAYVHTQAVQSESVEPENKDNVQLPLYM